MDKVEPARTVRRAKGLAGLADLSFASILSLNRGIKDAQWDSHANVYSCLDYETLHNWHLGLLKPLKNIFAGYPGLATLRSKRSGSNQ